MGPKFVLTHRIVLLSIQVSVLTDQVEAQGEKIRDLEFCLEEHREKLNATEEMLQQVCAKLGPRWDFPAAPFQVLHLCALFAPMER